METPDSAFDFEIDEEQLTNSLTDEQLCEKIGSLSSETLANIVVGYKYLGFYKNAFVAAMQELASRRAAGESFNFEEYIENSLKELPPLELKIPHLDMISQLAGISSIFSEKP